MPGAAGLLINRGLGCRLPQTTEGLVMADNQIRDRYDLFFKGDFSPLLRQDQQQGAHERTAYAAEFAAFHLGQIDSKLGRLIELLEHSASAKI
jgi:hypothetical protein